MLPHSIRFMLQTVEDDGYDNINPRVSLQKHLDARGLISRLHAAHQNSMESFLFFAAGVIAASQVMVSKEERNLIGSVASLYLFARIAYLFLYAVLDNPKTQQTLSISRTVAWFISTMCSSFLLIAAASKHSAIFAQ